MPALPSPSPFPTLIPTQQANHSISVKAVLPFTRWTFDLSSGRNSFEERTLY
jgi:hypothetical protein